MRRTGRLAAAIVALVIVGIGGTVAAPGALADNLHLVEALPNGFALYRSGKPDRDDVEEYCRLGIEEMCVLSGNAADHELRYLDACPTIAVVYDENQDADVPVERAFLEWFDAWVGEAREQGKRIAVRCNCGCHRTGRLIAYYQMRYQNLTTADALLLMYEYGENWGLHRNIEPQVRALRDYLVGRACTQRARYCVRESDQATEPAGSAAGGGR